MAISQSRKISAAVVAVFLLGGNLVAFLPAMLAGREIRRFCDGVAVGTPLAEVQTRAAAGSYSFEKVVGGHILVEHPRSLGRAYCDLTFDDKGLVSSRIADNQSPNDQ